MPGGLIQLAATGVDSLILINDPDITMFRRIYRRHTNFSQYDNILPFSGSQKFGSILTTRIENDGDLVHKLFLTIDLSGVRVSYETPTYQNIKKVLGKYGIDWCYTANDTDLVTETVLDEDIAKHLETEETNTCDRIEYYKKLLLSVRDGQITNLYDLMEVVGQDREYIPVFRGLDALYYELDQILKDRPPVTCNIVRERLYDGYVDSIVVSNNQAIRDNILLYEKLRNDAEVPDSLKRTDLYLEISEGRTTVRDRFKNVETNISLYRAITDFLSRFSISDPASPWIGYFKEQNLPFVSTYPQMNNLIDVTDPTRFTNTVTEEVDLFNNKITNLLNTPPYDEYFRSTVIRNSLQNTDAEIQKDLFLLNKIPLITIKSIARVLSKDADVFGDLTAFQEELRKKVDSNIVGNSTDSLGDIDRIFGFKTGLIGFFLPEKIEGKLPIDYIADSYRSYLYVKVNNSTDREKYTDIIDRAVQAHRTRTIPTLNRYVNEGSTLYRETGNHGLLSSIWYGITKEMSEYYDQMMQNILHGQGVILDRLTDEIFGKTEKFYQYKYDKKNDDLIEKAQTDMKDASDSYDRLSPILNISKVTLNQITYCNDNLVSIIYSLLSRLKKDYLDTIQNPSVRQNVIDLMGIDQNGVLEGVPSKIIGEYTLTDVVNKPYVLQVSDTMGENVNILYEKGNNKIVLTWDYIVYRKLVKTGKELYNTYMSINNVNDLVRHSLLNPFKKGTQLWRWYDRYEPSVLLDRIDLSNEKVKQSCLFRRGINNYGDIFLYVYMANLIKKIDYEIYVIIKCWNDKEDIEGLVEKIKCHLKEKIEILQQKYKDINDGCVLRILRKIVERRKPEYKWIHDLGTKIIEKVWITVDGLTIDSHSGELLDILNSFYVTPEKRAGFDKMIGNDDQMEVRKLYIPLYLWFCKDVGNSLPLVSTLYSNIVLNVQLMELDKLLTYEKSAKLVGTGLRCELMAQFILLDSEERKKFTDSKLEYLFERYYHTSYTVTETSLINLPITFEDPVKFLVWKVSIIYNKRDIQGVYDDIDPIESFTFLLNGLRREGPHDRLYYKSLAPYYRDVPELPPGVYFYSFALKPLEIQPSGSLNFSRVTDFRMTMVPNPKLTEPLENGDISLVVQIWGCSYNVLVIISGLLGLRFFSAGSD